MRRMTIPWASQELGPERSLGKVWRGTSEKVSFGKPRDTDIPSIPDRTGVRPDDQGLVRLGLGPKVFREAVRAESTVDKDPYVVVLYKTCLLRNS
jgi:hypothetical protein